MINQAINKRSKATKIDMLKESSCDIVHKQDIANTMNAYFCSVARTKQECSCIGTCRGDPVVTGRGDF